MSLAFGVLPVHQQQQPSVARIFSYPVAHNYPNNHSMDRGSSEYAQPGLPSPASYTSFSSNQPEPQAAEQQQPANYQSPSQDRSVSYSSSSATPSSEYSGTNSSAARTPSFQPEYSLGTTRYEGRSSGGMSHASHSSFSPLPPLAQSHQRPVKPDPESSEDPSTSVPSPSYPPAPPASSSYPHYPPTGPMSEAFPHPSTSPTPWRPEWTAQGFAQPSHMSPYGAHAGPAAGVATSPEPGRVNRNPNRKRLSDQQPQHPLSQVYSFVPIPGAQQHKRPRRRFDEIERMYKCGWRGCEKGYGTLNHLNAHVMMQTHGAKRTPEEFKEIRKEWKARKKQEEAERKAAGGSRRSSTEGGPASEASSQTPGAVPVSGAQYTAIPPRQLPPPLPFVSAPVPANVHYPTAPTASMESMQQYSSSQVYASYPPPSGYPQPMYGGAQQRQAVVRTPGNNNNENEAETDADVEVAATTQAYSQHSLSAN